MLQAVVRRSCLLGASFLAALSMAIPGAHAQPKLPEVAKAAGFDLAAPAPAEYPKAVRDRWVAVTRELILLNQAIADAGKDSWCTQQGLWASCFAPPPRIVLNRSIDGLDGDWDVRAGNGLAFYRAMSRMPVDRIRKETCGKPNASAGEVSCVFSVQRTAIPRP